jgi:hypothetical protein
MCGFSPHRFSDSEISGSKPVSGSPELIAAAHVLHRLSTPRHPPRALSSFSFNPGHALTIQDQGSPQERSSRLRIALGLVSYGYKKRLVSLFSFQRTGSRRIASRFGATVIFSAFAPIREPTLRGADRVRTDDPRLAKPMLSQLSYSPFHLIRSTYRELAFPFSGWAQLDLN